MPLPDTVCRLPTKDIPGVTPRKNCDESRDETGLRHRWRPSDQFVLLFAQAPRYPYSGPMEHTPLDLQPGDIVVINLNHPLRYANNESRGMIRLEVDKVSEVGISGRGSEIEGLVVPKKGKTYDRVGGDSRENPQFFPWASVQNLSLMYKAADYQALWDAEEGWD